jgi:hypothetical protein
VCVCVCVLCGVYMCDVGYVCGMYMCGVYVYVWCMCDVVCVCVM